MSDTATSTVHFCSVPEIVEIPRRSLWRRKLKPLKDRCCSACYNMSYFLCYPFVGMVRFCTALCNACKGTDSEPDMRRNETQRRDSHNLYLQSLAEPGVLYGSYSSHSGTSTKLPPQFL